MRIHLLRALNLCIGLFVILFLTDTVNGQDRGLDGFKATLSEAAAKSASLKRCTDEMDRTITQLKSDTAFATQVFNAATSGNTRGLQLLISQKAPSCAVSVTIEDKDFKFAFTFGNFDTGNHFYICFAGPRSIRAGKVCSDGTGADLDVVIK